jgi:hypothetical protein
MQKIDPFQPMLSVRRGKQPLILNVFTTYDAYVSEGTPSIQSHKPEKYILLSELPTELQRRVLLAIEALTQGL